MSNYAKIKNFDIANGDGIGVSIFLSGCDFKCHGCFNQELWDYSIGEKFTSKTLSKLVDMVANHNIDRLSLLGGEPLSPSNINTTIDIVKAIREDSRTKDKKIWLWTGYNIGELNIKAYYWLIKEKSVDFITFGKYNDNMKNLNRKYSGSDNQYTFDVKRNIVIE